MRLEIGVATLKFLTQDPPGELALTSDTTLCSVSYILRRRKEKTFLTKDTQGGNYYITYFGCVETLRLLLHNECRQEHVWESLDTCWCIHDC